MGIRIDEAKIEDVYPIRHQVLWPDKPFDFVKVAEDESGFHFGVYAGPSLVSVISLFPDGDSKSIRFRKFATLEDHQGKGYGRELLLFAMKFAQSEGYEKIWCDARTEALGFYEKLGFTRLFDRFFKETIEYYKIERLL
jgi:ribosomal protein S18 acetylase RimI-like enzyme